MALSVLLAHAWCRSGYKIHTMGVYLQVRYGFVSRCVVVSTGKNIWVSEGERVYVCMLWSGVGNVIVVIAADTHQWSVCMAMCQCVNV